MNAQKQMNEGQMDQPRRWLRLGLLVAALLLAEPPPARALRCVHCKGCAKFEESQAVTCPSNSTQCLVRSGPSLDRIALFLLCSDLVPWSFTGFWRRELSISFRRPDDCIVSLCFSWSFFKKIISTVYRWRSLWCGTGLLAPVCPACGACSRRPAISSRTPMARSHWHFGLGCTGFSTGPVRWTVSAFYPSVHFAQQSRAFVGFHVHFFRLFLFFPEAHRPNTPPPRRRLSPFFFLSLLIISAFFCYDFSLLSLLVCFFLLWRCMGIVLGSFIIRARNRWTRSRRGIPRFFHCFSLFITSFLLIFLSGSLFVFFFLF